MSDFINNTLTDWGDRWAGARASGDPTLQQALLIELRSTLYISTMPDQAEQLAAQAEWQKRANRVIHAARAAVKRSTRGTSVTGLNNLRKALIGNDFMEDEQ